jgi:hypothetical protein
MSFPTLGALGSFKDFEMGEMKFPEMKIGDAALPGKPVQIQMPPPTIPQPPPIAPPPRLPGKLAVPPPIKPRPTFSGR